MRLSHKIALVAASFFLFLSLAGAAVIPSGIPTGYTGKVFSGDTLKSHPQQIPGVIKIVFFDEGGEGVGFHEMDGTGVGGGGTMRPLAADRSVEMQAFDSYWDWTILNTPETLGSWHESWINSSPTTGDWTRATVKVLTAGTYTIDIHAACVDSLNSMSLTFNNATPIMINNLPRVLASQIHSGSEVWHIWNTFKDAATVDLDTGLYTLKHQFVQGGWNFDKLIFRLKNQTGTIQTGSAHPANSFNVKAMVSNNLLTATFNLPAAGLTKISVVDCTGKTVIAGLQKNLASGPRSEVLNLGNMSKGVYFIHLELNGVQAVVPFSVVR